MQVILGFSPGAPFPESHSPFRQGSWPCVPYSVLCWDAGSALGRAFQREDQKTSLNMLTLISSACTILALTAQCGWLGRSRGIGLRDFWLMLTGESVNDCENVTIFIAFLIGQLA